MHLRLVTVLALLGMAKCILPGKLSGWTPKTFPNPMKDPMKCGRKHVPQSQVCDPDGILTSAVQDEIEGHIHFIKSGQAAVAIVKKMDVTGDNGSNIDKAAEVFCRTLHDELGVGDKEDNDGVVIFLSIEDRVVYISTGEGSSRSLGGKRIQAIIHRMKPFLRKSDYGGALLNGILEVDMALSRNSIHQSASRHTVVHKQSEPPAYLILLILIVIAMLAIYVNVSAHCQILKLAGLERGRIALDSLIREVDNSTGADNGDKVFITTSCPICLENFSKAAPTSSSDGKTVTIRTAADVDNDFGGTSDGAISLLRATSPNPSAPVFAARTPPNLGNKPMALRCGHTFCKECITAHLKTDAGKRCPICRDPVDQDYDGLDSLPGGNGGDSNGPGRGAQEIRYRLNRMHQMYPDGMTTQLHEDMNRAVDRGALQDMRMKLSARAVTVQNTVTQLREAGTSAARASRSGGSSGSSFGGGRSSGGGGGRW